MLPRFFASKPEKDCYLFLDFASTNLKLVLVAADYNSAFQHPVFAHKTINHSLTFQQILEGEFDSLKQDLTKALSEIYNKTPFHVRSCIGGLDDIFFESTFNTSVYKLDPNFQIDMGSLQNILSKAQHQTRQSVLNKAKKRFKDIQIKLLQSDLVEIRIDNKTVTNPLGLSGSSMTVLFYNSFCQAKLFESISNLTDYIGFKLDTFILRPAAQASISQLQKQVIIEISHSRTSISLAQHGILQKTKNLDYSTNSLIEVFQERFNMDATEAMHALLAYCQDDFVREYRDMRKAVLISTSNLIDQIKQTLIDFRVYDFKETQIKLLGGGACLPEITELLEDHYQIHGQIHPISIKDFQFICDPISQISDPGFISSLAYANKFLQHKNQSADTSAAKANIDKILRLTNAA